MTGVPVLVCGNELRGDDGAAFAATTNLPQPAAALAAVSDVQQLEADLLLDPGIEPCVVVDTAIGVAPGAVVVYPLASVAMRRFGHAPDSSHQVPLSRAVALAETVLGRPMRGLFVGIGGERFEAGSPLSESVASAIPGARLAVAAAVERVAELRGITPPAHLQTGDAGMPAPAEG